MNCNTSLTLFPNRELRVVIGGCSIQQKASSGAESLALKIAESRPLTLVQNFKKSSPPPKGFLVQGANGQVRRVRPGWGMASRPKRMRHQARRKMLRCGAIMDARCVSALFCTMTLPGSTVAGLEVFSEWTGYLTNLLTTWLRGRIAGEFLWMSAWEWQKRGALHLHYVVGGSRCELEAVAKDLHSMWCKWLQKISGFTGIDLFARAVGGSWSSDLSKVQVDAQFVQKSVSAYLSKYLGKGSQPRSARLCASGRNSRFYPSRWTGMSRTLGRLLPGYVQRAGKRVPPDRVEPLRGKVFALMEALGLRGYSIRDTTVSLHLAVYGEGTGVLFERLKTEMEKQLTAASRVPKRSAPIELHHHRILEGMKRAIQDNDPDLWYRFFRSADLKGWREFHRRSNNNRVEDWEAYRVHVGEVRHYYKLYCDKIASVSGSAKGKKSVKGSSAATLDGDQMQLPF